MQKIQTHLERTHSSLCTQHASWAGRTEAGGLQWPQVAKHHPQPHSLLQARSLYLLSVLSYIFSSTDSSSIYL